MDRFLWALLSWAQAASSHSNTGDRPRLRAGVPGRTPLANTPLPAQSRTEWGEEGAQAPLFPGTWR